MGMQQLRPGHPALLGLLLRTGDWKQFAAEMVSPRGGGAQREPAELEQRRSASALWSKYQVLGASQRKRNTFPLNKRPESSSRCSERVLSFTSTTALLYLIIHITVLWSGSSLLKHLSQERKH
ncbi:hypothetical protein INR49_002704 [Caranx melampygus]|nr:hypothetical protein INR49_002704 [Caranx melampygus]